MSLESKIMPSVSLMMTFIREQVKNSIIEANNRDLIKLDRNDLEKIANIVDASIESSLYSLQLKILS